MQWLLSLSPTSGSLARPTGKNQLSLVRLSVVSLLFGTRLGENGAVLRNREAKLVNPGL